MNAKIYISLALILSVFSAPSFAEKKILIHAVNAKGQQDVIGQVIARDTEYGLVVEPNLRWLEPGLHGFHLHQNPSCEPKERDGVMIAALGAGSHYDPEGTGKHSAPWGDGHLGVLPSLYVNEDGAAVHPVLAPRIKLSDLEGRAFVIHAKGDNYSDHPAALGGGGPRVACGVIK